MDAASCLAAERRCAQFKRRLMEPLRMEMSNVISESAQGTAGAQP